MLKSYERKDERNSGIIPKLRRKKKNDTNAKKKRTNLLGTLPGLQKNNGIYHLLRNFW